jgi:thiosulfate/3-mercaptopyruvate sulfurtransferase
MTQHEKPQNTGSPLIGPDDVAEASSALLLDARPAEAFSAAHVAGAVRLPIERWEAAAKNPASSFDNVAFWEAEIGALGIDGARPILVYDDGRLMEAARVWFILQHFGAPARVIDGGWPHLADLPQAAGDGGSPEATAFQAKLAQGLAGLARRADVLDELDGPARILDARTQAEYTGQDRRKNARGGHLPGATLLPHTQLFGPDGRLLPAPALRSLFLDAGFEPGDRIITHCDGGGRAAIAALALLQAGFDGVRNYYLSFADWSKDESCPLAG